MNLFTTKGTQILNDDVQNIKPVVASQTRFLARIKAEALTVSHVEEACGCCEECYSNGMPHQCTDTVTAVAYFYKGDRLWGDLNEGFFVNGVDNGQ